MQTKKHCIKSLFYFLGLLPYAVFGQTGSVIISQNVPSAVSLCQTTTYTVTITNTTAGVLSGLTLTDSMPTGMNYIPGSVSSVPGGTADLNIANPQSPVFTLPAIGAFSVLTVKLNAYPDCGIVSFAAAGNPIVNIGTVTYPNATTDQNTSASYNISSLPSLVITSFVNQSYTGAVGTNFTRSITITNSGGGSLSSFTLTDLHGTGINILGAAPGILTGNATNDTITLSAADFGAIGNNNSLFENGESITITETVDILACISVSSNIAASWGCNNQVCQSATTTANVVVPNGSPNLVITATASTESCLGISVPRQQQLRIRNTGTGPAANVMVTVYNSVLLSEQTCSPAALNTGSFTWQLGINGTPASVTPDSAYNACAYACLGANPKYKADVILPVSIDPGDTIYLKWTTYTCCQSGTCSGPSTFGGWAFRGSYSNNCNTASFTVPATLAEVYHYFNLNMSPNNMPTDLQDGTTTTFDMLVTNWQKGVYSSAGAYYQVQITLPPCLVLAATVDPIRFLYNPNGSIWLPTSASVVGNVVTAIFTTPEPFALSNASLLYDLTADCGLVGCAGGSNSISVNVSYNPNPACATSCLLGIFCNTSSVAVHCPSPCPEGVVFVNYKLKRSSYGLPDNDNNGLPEAGPIDPALIRIDRAMVGDTLTGQFKGVIATSLAYPSFPYCYASTSISAIGTRITSVGANVTIYDASTTTYYNCSNIPLISAALVGSVYNTYYNVSPSYLNANGCGIPAGFIFETGDSIILDTRYRVTGNVGGAVVVGTATNEFYASDIVNPPPGANPANKFYCDNYSGNISLYGYYFTSSQSDNYNTNSCNTVTVSNNHYLSIGPCCQNYGSNNFPNEYRLWSHIDTVRVIKPSGYTFVSATIIPNGGNPATAITPLNALSDTLVFDIGALYNTTWSTYSFDGYSSQVLVTLRPGCNTLNGVTQPVVFRESHKQFSYLGGGNVTYGLNDYITYTASAITLQPLLPTVDGINSTEYWDVIVSNASNNSSASNSWISLLSPTGNINVLSVVDLSNSTTVTPTGGIYQLGTNTFNTSKTYRITFNYNTCILDSLVMYAGWDCSGYPASLSAYSCTPKTTTLYVDPQPSELQMQAVGPLQNVVALCDTTSYEVVLNSVQIASCYTIISNAILPAGMTVVPGSSQAIYPVASGWVSIGNPTVVGQNNQWNLSALIGQIGTSGLTGVNFPATGQVRIRFKVRTACNFPSGSTVSFSASGISSCGLVLPTLYATSDRLYIQGAHIPNSVAMTVAVDTIRPCNSSSLITVTLMNLGPDTTFGNEHFYFSLPSSANYIAGSFSAIQNAPANGIPSVVTGTPNYLDWQLPSGVQLFDSVRFTFEILVDPDSVECSNLSFNVMEIYQFNAVCVADNSICNVTGSITSANVSVPIGKPCLSITSFTASSAPAAAGENISVAYTIFNSCSDKATGFPAEVNFYFDNDNSGTYSAGDTFIGTQTTNDSILSNTGNTYGSISFFSSAAASCSILAVLDTAANACFCTNAQAITNLPLINAGNDATICADGNGLVGSVTTTGYTYSWSPVTGLNNPAIASPTVTLQNNTSAILTQTYVLTTVRGGCTSTDTVAVNIFPLIVPVMSSTNVNCNTGNDGSSSVTVTGGTAPYTYFWNPTSATTSTATGLSVGAYTVTITDVNGCSNTDTISITQPATLVSSTAQTTILCNGGTATASVTPAGGTSGYTYNWSDGQTTSATTAIPAGSYTVVVTDVNGCTSVNALTITEPTLLTSSTLQSAILCNGGTSTASVSSAGGTPGYSYSWSSGQSTSAVTGITAGNYSVTVTDANGCTNLNPLSITEPTTLILSSACSDSICAGDTTSLSVIASGGTPNYTYTWLPQSQTGPSISVSVTSSTSYSVTATDANGCVSAEQTCNVTVQPSPDALFDTLSNGMYGTTYGFTDLSTGGISWLWILGDGNTSTVQNPIHTFPGAGTYTVTQVVYNQFGCLDTFKIILDLKDGILIPNVFTPDGDGVNDVWYIPNSGLREFHVDIYDRWGLKVFESTADEIRWDGRTSAGKLLSDGTYYYVLKAVLASFNGDKDYSTKGHVTLLTTKRKQ